MPDRKLVIALDVAIVLSSALTFAQTAAPPLPRLPDGHPDLQGVWDFRSVERACHQGNTDV